VTAHLTEYLIAHQKLIERMLNINEYLNGVTVLILLAVIVALWHQQGMLQRIERQGTRAR